MNITMLVDTFIDKNTGNIRYVYTIYKGMNSIHSKFYSVYDKNGHQILEDDNASYEWVETRHADRIDNS